MRLHRVGRSLPPLGRSASTRPCMSSGRFSATLMSRPMATLMVSRLSSSVSLLAPWMMPERMRAATSGPPASWSWRCRQTRSSRCGEGEGRSGVAGAHLLAAAVVVVRHVHEDGECAVQALVQPPVARLRCSCVAQGLQEAHLHAARQS